MMSELSEIEAKQTKEDVEAEELCIKQKAMVNSINSELNKAEE